MKLFNCSSNSLAQRNVMLFSRRSSSFVAFTLIELLVVIAIIGMLIALMLPAVTASRDRARQAKCISNVKQTNIATMEYITRNTYFPGWKNEFKSIADTTNSSGINGSWIAALLPFLGEGALEKQWVKGVADYAFLPYLICPSDARINKTDPHLSYIANCGNLSGNSRDAGVFLDLFIDKSSQSTAKRPVKQTLDFITSNDGLATTIMTSENNQAYMWTINNTSSDTSAKNANISWQGFVFRNTNPNNMGTDQAINWDPRGVNLNNQTSRSATEGDEYARPSSYHPGGVNTSLCDGRVMKLSDDIDYQVYKLLLAPNDRGCDIFDADAVLILNEMINPQ